MKRCWQADKIRKHDTEIAKNYLQEDELDILNRIVTAYLEFAELQALNQRVMYMKDWKDQLDKFLTISGREVLNSSGMISHQEALDKVHQEYEKFHKKILEKPSKAEIDFVEFEKEIKKIENKKTDP